MADPTYDHVFAFITETTNNELECHAFLCPKRKMAKVRKEQNNGDYSFLNSDIQAATLTIAQGFSLAYQSWQMATRQKRTEFRKESKLQEGRVEEEVDNPDVGSILIQVCIYESRIYLQSLIKSGSN